MYNVRVGDYILKVGRFIIIDKNDWYKCRQFYTDILTKQSITLKTWGLVSKEDVELHRWRGVGGGVRGRLCVFAYAPPGNQLLLCVKRNLLI